MLGDPTATEAGGQRRAGVGDLDRRAGSARHRQPVDLARTGGHLNVAGALIAVQYPTTRACAARAGAGAESVSTTNVGSDQRSLSPAER
jgi:hypothetical protein